MNRPISSHDIELKFRSLGADPDAQMQVQGIFKGGEDSPPTSPDLAEEANSVLQNAWREGDFRGREDDELLLYGSGDQERVLLLGLGMEEDASPETLRRMAGRAVRRAEKARITSLHLLVPGLDDAERSLQAAAEGLGLAAWDFRELRSEDHSDGSEPRPPLVTRGSLSLAGNSREDDSSLAEAVARGQAFAAGSNLARTLQSRPGNIATPSHLAEVAEAMAAEYGFTARILGPAEMEAEGMGALLAVAAGSEQEPRLIALEHRGGKEGEAPLVLVGKGLTFDAGGISIKPASGMEDMKYDMSGGAAVLGAMKTIGILGLPVNVVGVVPSSENLISGKATKPGDVIRTREGKTVEVINTDAEGRLILADALSWAVDEWKPAAVVDCATLTGACVVALGHHAAALLGRDDTLLEELRDAGDRAGERCWPLPLWKPYRKQLESPVADLKNVGGRPAGAITAAHFLSNFVDENVPWAHLDIAGTAYGEARSPYFRDGAFGFPTRLLLEWVRGRSASGAGGAA